MWWSRHTTAPFIMLSLPQTRGTNPNITIALVDMTEPALKREGRYSRTPTTGQINMPTLVSVDGVDTHLEVPIDITSDFETNKCLQAQWELRRASSTILE